ncbi:substrate-binding domain-containing protein [Streptococcus henryi]|uniref:substrate-binding domain-containing protein n=1 Tax=Streptococcus henryi TaxID=439219 RepID=UPI00036C53E1|nr:substrate-binding domain-containing protein [Streptococcus henryi]
MVFLKKLSLLALVGLTSTSLLVACGGTKSSSTSTIDVVTREDGSGTRGAFIELFGVEKDDVDRTTSNAVVTNSTSVMMTTVAGDKAAIGYASLGSLDKSVKAVTIDGEKATVENVKNGSYKISRPFNIVTKDNLSQVSQDFMNFIMSNDGQAIVEDNGYIPVDTNKTYSPVVNSGKVVVSGSSSVSPVMEKLKEAYEKVNASVTVEVQTSDSTTGITDAIDGTSDLGMASRDLTSDESKKGVSSTAIAMDGIAVIVNKDNSIDNLSSKQVESIYVGDTTTWDGLSD